MAESYFSHLAHQEVSPAMVKRERKRKIAPVEEDSNSTKAKLESEQSIYNDFSQRMMVRDVCVCYEVFLLLPRWVDDIMTLRAL